MTILSLRRLAAFLLAMTRSMGSTLTVSSSVKATSMARAYSVSKSSSPGCEVESDPQIKVRRDEVRVLEDGGPDTDDHEGNLGANEFEQQLEFLIAYWQAP